MGMPQAVTHQQFCFCHFLAKMATRNEAVDAQGGAASAEEARKNANADASRLRVELTSLIAERDSLTQDLAASQKEVQQ